MSGLKKICVLIAIFLLSFVIATSYSYNSVSASNEIPKISLTDDGEIEGGITKSSSTNLYSKILDEYRTAILFVSGIGTLSMILFFILNLIALGNSKGNPQERQKAIHGLVITGVATAGLGSLTTIVGLFYHMIG